MNNKMDTLNGYLNGLNLNPIPLEFSQSMTTTKTLAMILAKLDSVIKFTNEWYETILTDIIGGGILYEKLTEEFLNSFGGEISSLQTSVININNSITSINDLITALEYVKPSVSVTSSPSIQSYSVGETINSIMINYNVIKGTNNLVKAEIYKNGTLLTTINNPLNGVNSYVDGTPVTSDTSYYVKVFDDKGNVQSNEIKFTFNYKAFYGKIADNATINEALVQSLNNVNFIDKFNFNVSLNNEKIIIVTYDVLSSVIDSDNFDMIESFNKTTLNLTINNLSTPYNVYVSTNTIIDNDVKIIIEK